MSSPREESFDYLESLAALNRSVVQFVKESLEEDPYCDLSTVGKKYEEHLMALAMASAGGDASKPFTSFSFGDTEDRDKKEQVGGQEQAQEQV